MLAMGATLALSLGGFAAAEASLRGAAEDGRRLQQRMLGDADGAITTTPYNERLDNATEELRTTVVAENSICVDTPGWTNGWKPCGGEDKGGDRRYCRPGSGWTCEGYVAKGWCRNDRCLKPGELNGVYACGKNLKSPELNCCACGKPRGPVPTTCAKEGCGGDYKPGKTCQCTHNCREHRDCCWDYDNVCRATPAPAPPRPPASCAYYGCNDGYDPSHTCHCNSDCERYNDCCKDYWSLCKRTPAPAPPPPVASCAYYGCNIGYDPSHTCHCASECERYNDCCADYWSLCKGGGPGRVTYDSYHGRNAYAPYGATNIDSDKSAPTGLSVSQCEKRCTQDQQCSCVTYKPSNGKCWKRGNCFESGWKYSNDYDVYLKVRLGSQAVLQSTEAANDTDAANLSGEALVYP